MQSEYNRDGQRNNNLYAQNVVHAEVMNDTECSKSLSMDLFSPYVSPCMWGEHTTCNPPGTCNYHFVPKDNTHIFSFTKCEPVL